MGEVSTSNRSLIQVSGDGLVSPAAEPAIQNAKCIRELIQISTRFGKLVSRLERDEREPIVMSLVAPLIGKSIKIGDIQYNLGNYLGSGASGFVFRADTRDSKLPVAIKFSIPFELAKDSTLNSAAYARDTSGGNFVAEVKSLQIIRDKGIPDAQTLISSAVARSGRNGSVIGIIVSELARGVQFIKLQDQIIQEKLPISIALQVYQRMAGTALALAQQGIAVDDLSPDHFIIELNSKNKIESARLVDFGSATFFDHEDIDCARRDNLEALCYGLAHLKLGQPSSRILEVVGYLEDAISDLNDGVVDFKTFSADLAKYQLNHT